MAHALARRVLVKACGVLDDAIDVGFSQKGQGVLCGQNLENTKPADLPVEQASKFDLAINLKAAQQIGLTLPDTLIKRADKVVT